jgi:N-ethylmaleimide reductase
MSELFSTFQLADLTLANRVVMAPMTRNRADAAGVATPLMASYYSQRAEAGLIVSESMPVSAQGVGYPCTPGLFAPSQIAGLRQVTDAVHARGGRIFAQLQHCGRISHPSHQPGRESPVAPSAVKPRGQAVTFEGMLDFVLPRALTAHEIADVVAQFKSAASQARAAGFDGVEIHGANGYLIDQFLRDGSNLRTDAYGGTSARRLTLLWEVIEAVATVWPRSRMGVRLSPENGFNDMSDSNTAKHFGFFVDQLSRAELGYLHVLEGDMLSGARKLDYVGLRRRFDGIYVANNGYDKRRAEQALRNGAADLVAFGTPFIANPDLVSRMRHDWPLSAGDRQTFYVGGATGYTDYPAIDTLECQPA